MKLSEAIRMNGMMRPQGFGSLSIMSPTEPCALGGALQSIGKQSTHRIANYIEIAVAWPWSNHPILKDCLVADCDYIYADATTNIFHLNDAHHWTREQIADWVASIESQEEQAGISGKGPRVAVLEEKVCR